MEIYPQYKDALNAKAGLLAGNYQLDKDLDQLLDGFYAILMKRHVPFLDKYMEYLNPRADASKLLNFYHRAGFELLAKQKKDYALAIKYLEYGLKVAPGNALLLDDLNQVRGMAGQ